MGVRILDVVYNAVSNELVRTKTLVKNAIVQVDAQPFKQWYLKHYGVELGKKKKQAEGGEKKGAKGDDAEKKTGTCSSSSSTGRRSRSLTLAWSSSSLAVVSWRASPRDLGN